MTTCVEGRIEETHTVVIGVHERRVTDEAAVAAVQRPTPPALNPSGLPGSLINEADQTQ